MGLPDSKHWLLAISTSHGVAEVYACDAAGGRLFSFEITDYKQQSARLLPELTQHLSEAGLGGQSAMAVAVNLGPGGFTSLRTACGVAQGLCVAWQVPCITASSFDAMWGHWILQGGSDKKDVLCLLDAKLQSLYVGRTTQGDDLLIDPAFEPSIAKDDGTDLPADLDNVLVLAEKLVIEKLVTTPKSLAVSHPSARGLAHVALAKWARGDYGDPMSAQPFYIREKVAQTTAERLAAKHG